MLSPIDVDLRTVEAARMPMLLDVDGGAGADRDATAAFACRRCIRPATRTSIERPTMPLK